MALTSLESENGKPTGSTDSITWFLRTICREPLLTASEEIELGNHIQRMMEVKTNKMDEYNKDEMRVIRLGKKSKDRMMRANLRLVVSVAKKYQGRGLELQDLIQEGTLGLERAVEKFDPTRGYKFSTYAFWWVRQSMTRAIATQSRSIRLPAHLSERLATVKRISQELSHKLGASPSRVEIAEVMQIEVRDLDDILRQSMSTFSLDEPIFANEGKSYLGDLIADSKTSEPLEEIEFSIYKEQLDRWINQLSEQEREVITLRFGLGNNSKHTLTEIGQIMSVSRERVRQIELKALRKLRSLTKRLQILRPGVG